MPRYTLTGYAAVAAFTALLLSFSQGLPPRPPPVDPKAFRPDPRATATLIRWDQRFRTGYVRQWNLSLQKELRGNLWIKYVTVFKKSGAKTRGPCALPCSH